MCLSNDLNSAENWPLDKDKYNLELIKICNLEFGLLSY